ncbi:endonuclease/exonuclease/phosphatase family protein [Jiangella mangrovi]|uniref:Endonuclease/exonuclease/phosphatase (EEP) superfamily protein YafD n=1 Tax=Jiangella mangrovi TaxID=1524084 RepID=A0A7W9GLF1_9ACTN|nr:endonuclease/exonuclease/phosphatase (EEP) superfamily protein YafD [Jiangella mangrovi]
MTPRGWAWPAGSAAAAALLAVLVVWPQAFGMAGVYGPAQVVALRGLTVVAGGAAAVGVAVLALVVRPARWPLAAVAGVVAVATVFSAGVLWSRGVWSDRITSAASSTSGEGEVQVLAFNTLYDGAGPEVVAGLITTYGADVVVLPETSAETTSRAATLAGGGFQVFHHQVDAGITSATGLLVATSLGTYGEPRPDPSGGLGSFTVRPEPGSDGPPITAVHAWPPTGDAMARWRDDTVWAVRRCKGAEGSIVAGDFNATLDHPALRSLAPCADAAAERDAAAVGTWPATWPWWAGAPIDHVLADARAWEVVSFSVLGAAGGSDHRPVLAVLRPAG